MANWMDRALEIGFSTAVSLDPALLAARADVRDMCAENRCKAYNKNWTCPPACGTIEECEARMRGYQNGILLQTVGHMEKAIDSKAYKATGEKHIKMFHQLVEEIRKEYPESLCLGAGGCIICKECAYPEPCRFPEKATSSMEGYGLFVTQVCRDCDVPYYYGEKTITYTACILY